MRRWKKMGFVLGAAALLFSGIFFGQERQTGSVMAVKAETTETTLPTDREDARDGCRMVGIRGIMKASQASAALDRMNQIRYEACQEGVKNPDNGQPLTTSDYVALKWSSDLEYIARIRAAEASVVREHTRPNGQSWNTLISSDGEYSWGENLAWDSEKDILVGINKWYEEKSAWTTDGDTGITSHYTNIISPSTRYVAVGQFYNTTAEYYNTIAAEFSNQKEMDSAVKTEDLTCIQKLEVKKSRITGSGSGNSIVLVEGQSRKLYPELTLSGSNTKGKAVIPGNYYWQSSNENNVSVNSEYGVAVGKKEGSSTVTATMDDGTKYSFTVVVRKDTTIFPTPAPTETPASPAATTAPATASAVAVNDNTINLILSPSEYTYDGTNKKPAVTVLDVSNGQNKNVDAANYEIEYASACSEVGSYPVTLKFKGAYTGTVTKNYSINPSPCTDVKAKGKKKKLNVSWRNTSGIVAGYEVQYSRKESFDGAANPKKVAAGTTSTVIKRLKKGKRYYVRVRCYKTIDENTFYSDWMVVQSGRVR